MLEPQVVFITGTNRGIGLEFVKQFLNLPKPPKNLFAACRNPSQATELQAIASRDPRVTILKLDTGSDTDIAEAVKTVESRVGEDGVNLLINNAGMDPEIKGLASMNRDLMIEHFDTNAIGPILMSKAFIHLLQKAANKVGGDALSVNKAAIINISTLLASIKEMETFDDFRCAYMASKCALNMATNCLAREVKSMGVMAVSIHPGWVRTDMGGPNGYFSTHESIEFMLKTISKFNENSAGLFYSYDGTLMAW